MKTFHKILIANRGEIAVRIIKTLKMLNIPSVAIYSKKDSLSLHRQLSDESYLIDGDELKDNYLNIDKIIRIARISGADAIHPGYGFLSENPEFAARVEKEGLSFIGPPADLIRLMGNKIVARQIAAKAGLPLIRGFEGNPQEILDNAEFLDFPVIIKAAAGGGGKAMRIVKNRNDLSHLVEISSSEARNYFGDGSLYVEKYFENGRHVEVQVISDNFGNIILAGERECTVQRRYQKIIEETPSEFISEKIRKKMFDYSRKLVKDISYINAGTIEYLIDEDQNLFFLEMNTRIQVEHPVTELTFGIDIVKEQIAIAAGNEMNLKQDDMHSSGHSIEARIYAEDPEKDFLASPGDIHKYKEPVMPQLRIDSGMNSPSAISSDYDPLISKVIVKGENRKEAVQLLQTALKNYIIAGIPSNREFILATLNHKEFLLNRISTSWLEKNREEILNVLEMERSKIKIPEIISIWLLSFLVSQKKDHTDPWEYIGYWRHLIHKTIVFQGKQMEIGILERNGNCIVFTIDQNTHKAELTDLNEGRINFYLNGKPYSGFAVTGKDIEDFIFIDGFEFRIKPFDYLPETAFIRDNEMEDPAGPRIIRSPLHGRVVKLNAMPNQKINKGEVLFTLDAMKIENRITSPCEGFIKQVHVNEGQQVSIDQEILIIDQCNK